MAEEGHPRMTKHHLGFHQTQSLTNICPTPQPQQARKKGRTLLCPPAIKRSWIQIPIPLSTLLETVASHRHKSDTIFVSRQTHAQHIFVEMILARTLVLSNLSLSEEEMEIELQKFEYLDFFCIVNKEDITESYPIVDINPRTWKQAIIAAPKSSIITSVFIAVIKRKQHMASQQHISATNYGVRGPSNQFTNPTHGTQSR